MVRNLSQENDSFVSFRSHYHDFRPVKLFSRGIGYAPHVGVIMGTRFPCCDELKAAEEI